MTDNNHPLDENLKRMLRSALDQPRPAFQERLVRDVLIEVDRERRAATRHRSRPSPFSFLFWWRPLPLASVAAMVLLCLAAWVWLGSSRSIGDVQCLYGLVSIEDRQGSQKVADTVPLKSGQRVRTASGSRAQVRLSDQSKLVPEPRTALQVSNTRRGARIELEEGTIALDAAKQAPGRAIRIKASSAQVTVLGTRLEVRVAEKPSGSRQTRVRVLSGQVELESAAEKVLLLPGNEGIADDGQPPVRVSVVPEVNEMIRLLSRTTEASAAHGRSAEMPAIIDFVNSTLWTMVEGRAFQPVSAAVWILRLKYPAFRVKAYSLDGAEFPTEGAGEDLRLRALPGSAGTLPEHLILKIPGLQGLLSTTEEGGLTCALPAGPTDRLSLVQLHFPASAQVELVSPAPLETDRQPDKLVLTIPVSAQLPSIHY